MRRNEKNIPQIIKSVMDIEEMRRITGVVNYSDKDEFLKHLSFTAVDEKRNTAKELLKRGYLVGYSGSDEILTSMLRGLIENGHLSLIDYFDSFMSGNNYYEMLEEQSLVKNGISRSIKVKRSDVSKHLIEDSNDNEDCDDADVDETVDNEDEDHVARLFDEAEICNDLFSWLRENTYGQGVIDVLEGLIDLGYDAEVSKSKVKNLDTLENLETEYDEEELFDDLKSVIEEKIDVYGEVE